MKQSASGYMLRSLRLPLRHTESQGGTVFVKVRPSSSTSSTQEARSPITPGQLLRKVRLALLELHRRGHRFSTIILELLSLPEYPELHEAMTDMRTFGVTSRKKIADLSPPAQPMKTCKSPAAYGIIYELPVDKPAGLPQTDATDAPYNGNTLVPPKRHYAHLEHVDADSSCFHYRAAAAAIDSIAFIKSIIENPAAAYNLIMTRCPLLAAKNPSVKQCVQALLITFECVNTAADRSCRSKVAYHQDLTELLGEADAAVMGLNTDSCIGTGIKGLAHVYSGNAVQRDWEAEQKALFKALEEGGITTDIIWEADSTHIVLPGALSTNVSRQIRLGVLPAMRKELNIEDVSAPARVSATLRLKRLDPPRKLAIMVTAEELRTLALYDFLLEVNGKTASLLVHGSHGGMLPEHASAFVQLVGDTRGRADLTDVIPIRPWMADEALEAYSTKSKPSEWSEEYFLNVSNAVVGIAKAAATVPATAGSTSWRFAFCSHTPDVVSITVPAPTAEERALAEALDVAFAYTGKRTFKYAYCARGDPNAVTEFKDLDKPFVTAPMAKFMDAADSFLGREVAAPDYGTMRNIPYPTQWQLLVNGTFPFPGGRGRNVFGDVINPPAWAVYDGVATLRLEWATHDLLWWNDTLGGEVAHSSGSRGSVKTKIFANFEKVAMEMGIKKEDIKTLSKQEFFVIKKAERDKAKASAGSGSGKRQPLLNSFFSKSGAATAAGSSEAGEKTVGAAGQKEGEGKGAQKGDNSEEDKGGSSSVKGKGKADGQPSTPTKKGAEVLGVAQKGANTPKKVKPEDRSSKGGSAKRARLDAKGPQRPATLEDDGFEFFE